MLAFFDFECRGCKAVSEDFVEREQRVIKCPLCGEQADRIMSAVRIDRTRIATTVGASPESIAHFDRVHRQRKAIEERNMLNHGDYGKAAGSD